MKIFRNLNKQEKGHILVLTMIVVGLCSLIVVPLVNYMGTGIRVVNVYRQDTNQVYAADSGIQYAMWKIINDSQITSDRADATYGEYSYDPPGLNNNTIHVDISTNWLFGYLFRIVPGETPHQGALITTCSIENGVFTLNYSNPTQNPIVIQKFGVWLPPGFSYVAGSSSGITSQNPAISYILGGYNLVWDVNHNLGKESSASQQFSYDPAESIPDGATSWVFPQQQSVGASWDDSIWWYDVSSTATNSSGENITIEAIIVYNDTESSSAIINYLINP